MEVEGDLVASGLHHHRQAAYHQVGQVRTLSLQLIHHLLSASRNTACLWLLAHEPSLNSDRGFDSGVVLVADHFDVVEREIE